MTYAKGLLCPEAKLLDEETVHECLTIDNDAPVPLQMSDIEICDMIVNENSCDDSDSDERIQK